MYFFANHNKEIHIEIEDVVYDIVGVYINHLISSVISS